MLVVEVTWEECLSVSVNSHRVFHIVTALGHVRGGEVCRRCRRGPDRACLPPLGHEAAGAEAAEQDRQRGQQEEETAQHDEGEAPDA